MTLRPVSSAFGANLPDLVAPGLLLRRPVATDAEAKFAKGRDPEIMRNFGVDASELGDWTREQAEAWVQRVAADDYAWVVEADGAFWGNVRLGDVNWQDMRARIALGCYAASDMGRGVGRRVISCVLDHAFGSMNLHRVDLRVIEFNTSAIRCYEACGFRREGVEREAARVGGQWYDEIIMAKLQSQHFSA